MDDIMNSNPYTGIMSKFSASFQLFIKEIGDAKSKTDEDRIFCRELISLQETLLKPGITSKQIKECIVRMIHCEMLGYDVSFANKGYMEVVKFAQQQNLLEKRVAYAALALFLDEKNEIECMMNIGSIQRDLKNTNIMQVCFGLIAASRLVYKDMLPAVLPRVAELMKHNRDVVRKKAVMTLLKFYDIDKDAVISAGYMDLFHTALCDKDPAVMSVSLNAYFKFVSENPSSFKRLTASFVTIWKQILNRKLPDDFNHRGVPSPWMQIKLLQILAMLGSDDVNESKKMYEILKQCLDDTDTEQTIGCAVVYECMKTVATVYPNRALIEFAANKAGLFLVSNNNNLKYLGITALSNLIHIDISYATKHQKDVIECLNDQDDSIKRKTLELLYRMTNSSNVKIICEKLINYLRSTVDDYVKSDLVTRITTLAEKFSPDNEWFIETMNDVFELGGELVQVDVAYNMMRIIGEGTDNPGHNCPTSPVEDKSLKIDKIQQKMNMCRSVLGIDEDEEDEEATDDLRRNAVISYTYLIEKPSLPDILIQLICWVVGEYIDLVEDYDLEDLVEKFYKLLRRRFSDTTTQSWVITALTKILSKMQEPQKHIRNIDITMLTNDAQQRYREMIAVIVICRNADEVLPYDMSCEDIEIDSSLSFLDGFVNQELQQGAASYSIENKRNINLPNTDEESEGGLIFNYVPKETPISSTPPLIKKDSERSISPRSTSSDGRPAHRPWTLGGLAKKQTTSADCSGSEVSSLPSNEVQSVNTSGSSSKDESISDGGSTNKKIELDHPARPDPNEKLLKQLFGTQSEKKTGGIKKNKLGNRDTRVVKSRKKPLSLLDMSDDSASSTPSNNDNNIVTSAKEGPEKISSEMESELNIFDKLDISDTHQSMSLLETHDMNTSDFLNNSASTQQSILLPSNQLTSQVNLLDDDLVEPNSTAVQPGLATTLESYKNLSLCIPEDLNDYKYSPNQIEICKDMHLRMMCQYVYKPTELAIVLYIVNQSVQTLTDIHVVLKLPSNLRGNPDEMNFHKSSIDSMNSFNHVVNVTYQSPALHMVLTGHVTYKDFTKTNKKLFISNHVMSMSCLLREVEIDVNAFTSRWLDKSLYEKKEKLNGKHRNMNEFLQLLNDLNIYPVQVIDEEIICSSSILNKHDVQLHFKLSSINVHVSIRSNSRLLNDSIMKMLSTAI